MSCEVLPAGLSMSRTPSDTGVRLVAPGRPTPRVWRVRALRGAQRRLVAAVEDVERQVVGQDPHGLVLHVGLLLPVDAQPADDRRLVALGYVTTRSRISSAGSSPSSSALRSSMFQPAEGNVAHTSTTMTPGPSSAFQSLAPARKGLLL